MTLDSLHIRYIFGVYCIMLIGSALAAYRIGPFPIQWMVESFTAVSMVYLGFRDRLYVVTGSGMLLWISAYAVVVMLVNLMAADYKYLMPPLATTPYEIFISLRIFRLFIFMAVAYMVYWLAAKGRQHTVIRRTVIIGTIISIASMYIYIAQIYGLPEIPRNRIGTSGTEQFSRFSYAFHRAMGTFREPSHLAEWLVTPFFLSFMFNKRGWGSVHTIFIGGTLLLTGSLTGILGALIGTLLMVLMIHPLHPKLPKIIFSASAIGAVSLLVFNLIAVSYSSEEVSLINVTTERVSRIWDQGMYASNRGIIYQYVSRTPFPLFGVGLGNSNLTFAEFLGASIIPSHLSLYYNFLYSLGVVGFSLLVLFLAGPIVLFFRNRDVITRQSAWILGSYLSWLVIYGIHAEELNTMFAISFALLIHNLKPHRPEIATDASL